MSILREVLKNIFDLPPTAEELRAELNYLNQEATDVIPLIPWADHEIDIVSIQHKSHSTRRKKLDKLIHIDSIYHEPLLSYASKTFRRKKDVSLEVIFTEKDRFTYLTQKGVTKVYYESQIIGRFLTLDHMLAPNKNTPMLRWIPGKEEYGALLAGDVAWAQVINVQNADSKNPRAFILLASLSQDQRILFKGYAFYVLFRQIVGD